MESLRCRLPPDQQQNSSQQFNIQRVHRFQPQQELYRPRHNPQQLNEKLQYRHLQQQLKPLTVLKSS